MVINTIENCQCAVVITHLIWERTSKILRRGINTFIMHHILFLYQNHLISFNSKLFLHIKNDK